jgi:hypothetical protein
MGEPSALRRRRNAHGLPLIGTSAVFSARVSRQLPARGTLAFANESIDSVLMDLKCRSERFG